MKHQGWLIIFLLLVLMLTTQSQAATLNFNNNGSLSALNSSGSCSGSWSHSNGVFSCNGQVSFASGDLLRTSGSSVTISANAGISLNNNSVGTSGNRINLQASYGAIQVNGSSAVFGNIQNSSGGITVLGTSSAARAAVTGTISTNAALSLTNLNLTGSAQGDYGAVTLTSVSVSGNLASSGTVSLSASGVTGSITTSGSGSITNGSSVNAVSFGASLTSNGTTFNGTVTVTNGGLNTANSTYKGNVSINNAITANNDVFMANLTSTNGSLDLTGGSVTGLIYSPCCTLTTNNTNLAGGATVKSGISITGGTISGDYTMTSANPAVVNNVTMTSGSITSASTVTINNSTLGSDTSPVLVTSVSGRIEVNDSTVFGDLITPDYDKVYVNGSSQVTGSCIPLDEPRYACGGVATVTRNAYWRFDETLWNGTAAEVKDSSTDGRHGRAINGAEVAVLTPSPASCSYGDFQRGSSSSNNPHVFIDRNAYFHDADNFGFTLWLRMTASAQPSSGRQVIMAYGDEEGVEEEDEGRFELVRTSSGSLRFAVRMQNENLRYVETSGTTIFNGQWQHIAFSYSKTNRRMRLYVNNVLVTDTPNSSIGSSSSQNTPNDGNTGLSIGALPGGDYGIRGQIDEVRFFNYEPTSADVKTMYEQAASCTNECFTETFVNDTNWYLTQRNSTPPSLKTSPSRLRLTENLTRQATSITFKRSFPALNNKLEIQFDHYAYGGNGADGIGLVLSDATVTPVPGSYGGSLGYAQRTNVNPSQSGFAGGWLGIGFDEFGNFSQQSEGRSGGNSYATANAIGVRAAASTNYGWIGGTGSLSPGLWVSGSSLGRGDRYRITLDSRGTNPQTVSFKLERRQAGSSSFSTLLTSSNLLSLGQPAPPQDLLLSYTGSTGDNTNIHEITNVQVCTVKASAPVQIGGPSVHHIELSYPPQGLTCESSAVTVKACADATCSTLFSGAMTVTLAATNGASWVGGNQVTLSNGQATKYLSKTSSGDSVVSVTSASVALTNAAAVCKEGSATDAACSMSFQNTGLRFSTIPNQVAGLTSPSKVKLQVVRTDTNTGACVARVTPSSAVKFAYQCVNPTSCITGQSFTLDGSAVAANPSSAVTQYSSQTRIFNSSAETEFEIKYSDVGQLKLYAQLDLAASGNEPALSLSQESNAFVVKPDRIAVTAVQRPDGSSNPGTTETGTGFVPAGQIFRVQLDVQNREGNRTPNFGKEITPERLGLQNTLAYPTISGTNCQTGTSPCTPNPDVQLSAAGFTAVSGVAGRFENTEVSWLQAGSINLSGKISDNDYLGAGDTASASPAVLVGRFYPDRFVLQSSVSANSCSAGSFSYMSQPAISASAELRAVATNGSTVLTNYNNLANKSYAGTAVIQLRAANGGTSTDLSGRLAGYSAASWRDGVWSWSQTNLSFTKQSSLVPDGPLTLLQLGLSVQTEVDNRGLASTMAIGAAAAGSPLNLRFGRLVLRGGNVADAATSGSTAVPVWLGSEYWNGSAFVSNTDDHCTAINATALSFDSSGATLTASGTAHNLNAGQSIDYSNQNPITNPNWTQGFRVNVPANNTGVWPVFYTAPIWLKYNWQTESGTAVEDDPSSEISVGRYRGNKRQIYWQEQLN
ncbi:DUF6701 domain-containing protein [Rheinheimera sp.]|uniref:DUF6701 domain-containing protein n=1 Tax=Rheinheimera sp. TaxID=1869214 RepID=UPI00307CDA90